MKKNIYLLVLLVLLLSLALGACTRSATKGGGEGIVNTPDVPFPVGPDNNSNRITEIVALTATAAAQVPEETATSQPVLDVPTATAQAALEETPKSVPMNTPIVVPTATPGLPATYTVQEGEFPYCLARRFNINPNDLLAANNISGLVAPGTTLTIPSNSTWPSDFPRSLLPHPTTYNVLTGDTIYKIACAFGDVDPNDIIAANGLLSPFTLTAGQVINIP